VAASRAVAGWPPTRNNVEDQLVREVAHRAGVEWTCIECWGCAQLHLIKTVAKGSISPDDVEGEGARADDMARP
jgi:hypothetical protein